MRAQCIGPSRVRSPRPVGHAPDAPVLRVGLRRIARTRSCAPSVGTDFGEVRLRGGGPARLSPHDPHQPRLALSMRVRNDNVVPLRAGGGRAAPLDVPVRPPHRVALFTRYSLASYLGVHVNTIDRLVARGEIPAYRIAGKRRFYPEDVERYIRKHGEEPR